MYGFTLWNEFSNFVFLGEGGSGKTDLSVNFALNMAACAHKPIHFFDMDQTKPMLRARDASSLLEQNGIKVHYTDSLLDTPIIPHGVGEILHDSARISILDVGGGLRGARMIGQFSKYLDASDTVAFYIINSYSSCLKEVRADMEHIMRGAGVSKVSIIANPNVGAATTREDVLQGLAQTSLMLEEFGLMWDIAAVQEKLLPLGWVSDNYGIMPIIQHFAH